jgi:amino acid adenylation domain-containing protein
MATGGAAKMEGQDRPSFRRVLHQLMQLDAYAPVQHRERTGTAEMSFSQQRLWFLCQFEGASVAYNILEGWRLIGPLNLQALERSLVEIIRRHEALRTTFPMIDGRVVQRIRPHFDFKIDVVDFTASPASCRERQAEQAIAKALRKPFDLARGPLFRATLIKLEKENHILLLMPHHIVGDGTSIGILLRELCSLYDAFSQGRPSPLEPLDIQYADFAEWQSERLQGAILRKQLAYWSDQLKGVVPLELPTERARPAQQSYRGDTLFFSLDPSLTNELSALSRHEGTTLFMLLVSAFHTLLHRYTHADDLVTGSPMANRNRPELESLIGFFVNSMVLRSDFSGDPTFREILKRMRETVLWAYVHRDVPFEKMVEALQPGRDATRNPVFQIMFAQQKPSWKVLNLRGLQSHALPIQNQTAKLDLSMYIVEEPHALSGWLEYSTDLFERSSMKRLLGHFQSLLKGLVANPGARVSDLPLLTPEEEQDLLVERNQTAAEYPRTSCIHDLFEARAAETPEALAFSCAGEGLTCGQLNAQANRLARYLRGHGVLPNYHVGLCMPRSLDMAVALLAILKTGAAYVPLDPAYPSERLSFLIQDSAIDLLLSDSMPTAQLAPGVTVVPVRQTLESLAKTPADNLGIDISPESAAYVIYTSGSTGQPKGVVGSHRGALNRLTWMWMTYPFTGNEVCCAKTSLSFVDSVWEIWGGVLWGVRTVLVEDQVVQDPQRFVALLAREQVTRLVLVPSLLSVLLESYHDLAKRLPHLQYWVSSGEPLLVDLLQRFQQVLPDRILLNLYGSTEVAADATCYDTRTLNHSRSVPIGRPIANTQVYILGPRMLPVPVGVCGELYVAGEGLAIGYWNRPELTSEKFIPDPFSKRPGARLFRTGDRASYLADGNIEYMGRVDRQVKVRGVRIELEEIEATLAQHPRVRQAAVTAIDDGAGDNRLVAFVVRETAKAGTDSPEDAQREITKAVQERIPEWQHLWDATYSQNLHPADSTFDTSGWNSSYTGTPIPPEQMREWLDHTVDRILALGPQSVLEIGAGSGMLLHRIAPQCIRYCGTDFSPTAIKRLEAHVKKRGLRHVELRQQPAEDFSGFECESFDTVILNSVIQYFPNVAYLVRVLEGATRILRPRGTIFIGDVRNLPLLGAFHASVEMEYANSSTSLGQLRQRIQKRIFDEHELVIDPLFFSALGAHIPLLKDARVLLKRGTSDSEMNRYRYDVVLSERPPVMRRNVSLQYDWEKERGSLESVRNNLREAKPVSMVLKSVPNARVAADFKAFDVLQGADLVQTVTQLRGKVRSACANAVHPEDFWGLAKDLGYSAEVCLTWTGGPDCYDVRLERDGFLSQCLHADPPAAGAKEILTPEWSRYANDPMQSLLSRALIPQLRAFLKDRLPDNMSPSAYVILEKFPLTPSGKIDRLSLIAPAPVVAKNPNNTAPAQTAPEEILRGIWRELLQVENIHRDDNFFDLGGHSLVLVRLRSKLLEIFHQEFAITELFRYPTISSLAARLGRQPGGKQFALQGVYDRAKKQQQARQRWEHSRPRVRNA